MFCLVESYLLVSILFYFMFGTVYTYSPVLKFPQLSSIFCYLAIIINLNCSMLCVNNSFLNISLFNNLLLKDYMSNLTSLFIILLNILVLVCTQYYNSSLKMISFEFVFFMLFLTFNSILFISMNNFFLFFILLEVQSIILFILSSMNKRNSYSMESSLKYFILGSFSSMIMLLGISLIYITTSFFFFDDLNMFFFLVNSDKFIFAGVEIGIILISMGFFFKLYSAPFHFWVSDMYQGSATSSVLIFSTSSVFVFYFIFIKLYFLIFFNFFSLYSNYLLFFALLSMFFGTIGGLVQKRLKRILAYSSMTVTGYIFFILFSESLYSIDSMFFFLLTYIIMLAGVIIIFSNILVNNISFMNFSKQLMNFFKSNKLLSFLLGSFLFSLGGIPPFIGFISKFSLLVNFFLSSSYEFLFLFLMISTFSFLYYVSIVKFLYSKKITYWVTFDKISYLNSLVMIYVFFFSMLAVFFTNTILLFCKLIAFSFICM